MPARKKDWFTEEDKFFIEKSYKNIPVSKISKGVNVSMRTVYKYLHERGLITHNTDTTRVRKQKRGVPEGIFDYENMDNLFIG